MKTLKLTILIILYFCLNGFSQVKLPVEFRVEKQSMSTPMSTLDDMFFMNYYYAKPVNIKFDGSILSMYYDNGATFIKKNVAEVKHIPEYENNSLVSETILYTDKDNVSDTISYILDFKAGFVQIVLPSKNSTGENIGYTSYKKFDKKLIKENDLALN